MSTPSETAIRAVRALIVADERRKQSGGRVLDTDEMAAVIDQEMTDYLQAIDDLLVFALGQMSEDDRNQILYGIPPHNPTIERALALLSRGRPNGPITVSLKKAIDRRGLQQGREI